MPPVREEYAGVILSLARQDDPDTSAYNDPEVHLRIKKHHHAGLVLKSTDANRIPALFEDYARASPKNFWRSSRPATSRPRSPCGAGAPARASRQLY